MEIYSGVKFQAVRVGDFCSGFLDGELKTWARIFHDSGLAPPYVDKTTGKKGSFGNMGYFFNGEIRVTASGSSLENILPAKDIVRVDYALLNRRRFKMPFIYYSGNSEKKPTSEAEIYWRLFNLKCFREGGVILHGHHKGIVDNADLLAQDKDISVTQKFEEYGTREFALQVLIAFRKKQSKIVIARNHGFFSFGETFDEAGERALDLLHLSNI